MKLYSIILSASFLILTCIAHETFAQSGSDPVFVKIDRKLGKVTHHRVLEHETLYSISRRYGVPAETIMQANPKVQPHSKKLPPVLSIPISDKMILTRIPLFKNKNDYLPVYYTALKKDNLFKISRQYFDIPTNLLANRNNISGNRIREGQTLHIGWLKRVFTPLDIERGRLQGEEKIIARKDKTPYQVEFEEMGGADLTSKNTVAYWKADATTKGYFVMHRSAPERSIIEIVNPLSATTVYAKVIARIPDHLYAKEIDMVVSREVAEELQARDQKFFVRSRYVNPRTSASR